MDIVTMFKKKYDNVIEIIAEGPSSNNYSDQNNILIVDYYNNLLASINEELIKKDKTIQYSVVPDPNRQSYYHGYGYYFDITFEKEVNHPKNIDHIMTRIFQHFPEFSTFYDKHKELSFKTSVYGNIAVNKARYSPDGAMVPVESDISQLIEMFKREWATEFITDYVWICSLIQKYFIGETIKKECEFSRNINKIALSMKSGNTKLLDFVTDDFLNEFDSQYEKAPSLFFNKTNNNVLIYESYSKVLNTNYVINLFNYITNKYSNISNYPSQMSYVDEKIVENLGLV